MTCRIKPKFAEKPEEKCATAVNLIGKKNWEKKTNLDKENANRLQTEVVKTVRNRTRVITKMPNRKIIHTVTKRKISTDADR